MMRNIIFCCVASGAQSINSKQQKDNTFVHNTAFKGKIYSRQLFGQWVFSYALKDHCLKCDLCYTYIPPETVLLINVL